MLMDAKRKGTAHERRAMEALQRAGYTVCRSAGSFGPVDLWAINSEGCLRLVQVKAGGRVSEGEQAKLKALADRLPYASVETWVWHSHTKAYYMTRLVGGDVVETTQIKYIPTDQILEPADQMRSLISQEGIEELAQSIRQVGLIEPIVVAPMGTKYEVIVGHRRLLACRAARIPNIPCQVVDGVGQDPTALKLHENLYREDVNPADEGEFLDKLHLDIGLSTEEIARKIGKSQGYVRDRLSLVRGDPAILEAVRRREVNPSVARELNQIDDEETRRYYLGQAVTSGATLATVRVWRTNWAKETQTKAYLALGGREEDLPEALPIYYYICPMCERGVEVADTLAISLCTSCYNEASKAFQGGQGKGEETS